MKDERNRLRFREYIHIQVGSKLPTPRRPLPTAHFLQQFAIPLLNPEPPYKFAP
jgi:hypothetical protein